MGNVRSILEKCATSAKKKKMAMTSDDVNNPLLNKDLVEKALAQKEIILQSLTGEQELVVPRPSHSTLHESGEKPVPRLGLSQLAGTASHFHSKRGEADYLGMLNPKAVSYINENDRLKHYFTPRNDD